MLKNKNKKTDETRGLFRMSQMPSGQSVTRKPEDFEWEDSRSFFHRPTSRNWHQLTSTEIILADDLLGFCCKKNQHLWHLTKDLLRSAFRSKVVFFLFYSAICSTYGFTASPTKVRVTGGEQLTQAPGETPVLGKTTISFGFRPLSNQTATDHQDWNDILSITKSVSEAKCFNTTTAKWSNTTTTLWSFRLLHHFPNWIGQNGPFQTMNQEVTIPTWRSALWPPSGCGSPSIWGWSDHHVSKLGAYPPVTTQLRQCFETSGYNDSLGMPPVAKNPPSLYGATNSKKTHRKHVSHFMKIWIYIYIHIYFTCKMPFSGGYWKIQ